MGQIYDIKHYIIHDGPGIRTTIFFKGCPLNCPWCHNPESKEIKSELMWIHNKCIGCRACLEACPVKAISFNEKLRMNDGKCILCGECADACYTEALRFVGKDMTVTEVMKEISKDRIFHYESNGGVTFSGGEPLFQPDFLLALLEKCKTQDIHTAIDTSGYVKRNTIKKMLNHVDLWLYDLKHMDSKEHERVVGVPNETILNNLQLLAGRNVWIRMPLIPGFNDSVTNINALADFMKRNGFNDINILPYHTIGSDKMGNLISYKRKTRLYEKPTKKELEKILFTFIELGINAKIGG